MSDDDDLLAAELALGLTDDAVAAARSAKDPVFAARVAWWEQKFAGIAVPLDAEPSPAVWTQLSRKLPANDNPTVGRGGVLRWQLLSGTFGAVAAVALLMLAQRPSIELPPQPGAPAVASLSGEKGSAVAISYDGTVRRLTVAPVQLDVGQGDAELWVIPVGQTEAISLGVVDAHKASSHQLTPVQAKLVAAGATFAISLEPIGGSPTGHATGPIVASGKLIET